ncbi:MAG: hypothetical protein ISS71_04540 [Phycisphaerae bacterium]|nr:hypothetical protein [Phycisphaerae bacterium]
MRKSGLQKQIAFIFNDVPVPQTDPEAMQLPIQQQAQSESTPDSLQGIPLLTPEPADEQQKASSVPQTTTTQIETVHTPAVSTLRPKPLPKSQSAPPKPKTGQLIVQQVKKVLYGASKGKMDPRQKKMTLLVGGLSLVFAGILVVSLGGLGQKKPATAKADVNATGTSESQESLQWQMPQPLPTQLRNPMIPQAAQPDPANQDAAPGQSGQMIVRGIVFSENNSSAIINGKIVRQGETLEGIQIVKINKDSVEFKQGEKSWTQQVQR